MFDRYQDIQDVDPLVYAREQLRKAGIVSSAVCVALQDSIVYGKVEVLSTDPGMPMWPSQPTEEVEA